MYVNITYISKLTLHYVASLNLLYKLRKTILVILLKSQPNLVIWIPPGYTVRTVYNTPYCTNTLDIVDNEQITVNDTIPVKNSR